MAPERRCRICRCTWGKPCPGGCAWISAEFDVCTRCAHEHIAELTPAERAVAVVVLYGVDPTPAPPDDQRISWG